MMTYVANARMYSVSPAAAAAWKSLFGWLSRRSGVELDVIDHSFPAPLSELWSRADIACVFMCGYPFLRAAPRPKPVAAPLPRGAPGIGRPLYATRLVVRWDSPYQRLEDTFGGRLGYTVEDSHSGFNALRHHLLPYRLQRGANLYRDSIGPLYTPRRVIDAVIAGTIDVGPLDSYALDLMLRHDPELDRRIRVVSTTEAAPIPFLVAAPQCPDEIVAGLRAALMEFGEAPECAALRDGLCLHGFAPVTIADYEIIAGWDEEARAAGYALPA
jgi:ABC-type phosphate/phosphonate transport system substrate-binding protein